MAKDKSQPPEANKPDPDAPAPGAEKPPADPPPPPPDGKGNKKSGKGYVCVEPVKHKGKRHMPGDPIELTDAEAKPLLADKAVAAA